MYKTLKKMLAQAEHIFDTLELTTTQKIFVTVWPPGATIITLAENWNFELNFFLVNSFGEKMTSQ